MLLTGVLSTRAGVPLVTLPRRKMVSRLAASLIVALGAPELIARTTRDFAALARALAASAARAGGAGVGETNASGRGATQGRGVGAHARVAARVRAARKSALLFDMDARARAFERAVSLRPQPRSGTSAGVILLCSCSSNAARPTRLRGAQLTRRALAACCGMERTRVPWTTRIGGCVAEIATRCRCAARGGGVREAAGAAVDVNE